jgi:hypothetical protein
VVAVNWILRYLKVTNYKGLHFKPNYTDQVDCFVDADFAGMFIIADVQVPVLVNLRTGYLIIYSGVKMLWFSKMQTHIAFSTMEAE